MEYPQLRCTTRGDWWLQTPRLLFLLPALTMRLTDLRVMVVSPESPTSGLGFSAISDKLISILLRVVLKIISAELPVSTNILATSISWIVSSMTRRSFRGLAWSAVSLSLNEMTSLPVRLGILLVDRSVIFEFENPSPPPSSPKLWEPKFTPSILLNAGKPRF